MRLSAARLSNYFKRYIERELDYATLRRKWQPVLGLKEIKKRRWHYNEHRPWTDDFKQANTVGKIAKFIPVQPIKDYTLFKGDRVMLMVGKDRGKQGIINCIIKERNWAFVEGLNCEYKTQQGNPNSNPICIRKELPLLIPSQVKLVDPADEQGTEVEWRFTEQGTRVRVSVRSGRIIPLPDEAAMLEDFVLPKTYQDNAEKDTSDKDLTALTFEAKLCTFEQDIMDQSNIKDDRRRAKTYWY